MRQARVEVRKNLGSLVLSENLARSQPWAKKSQFACRALKEGATVLMINDHFL
jgi:hypothetical protein